MEKCKNCGTETIGVFCHQCGQKSTQERIVFKDLLKAFLGAIWGIDQGLVFTFKRLTYKPKETIVGYLEGKRKALTQPLNYLIITSALSLLVNHGVHSFYAIPIQKVEQQVAKDTNEQALSKSIAYQFGVRIVKIGSENLGLLLLGYVPIAGFMSFLFFRRAKYNFWEHLVLNTYIIGQINLLLILFPLLQLLQSLPSKHILHFFEAKHDIDLMVWLMIGFFAFYLYQIFSIYRPVFRGIRAFVAPVCGGILFLILGLVLEALSGITNYMSMWF